MSTPTGTISPFVTSDELAAMLDAGPVVCIDVRDPEDFAAGHIPGAVSMPDVFTFLADTDPDGLRAFEEHFGRRFAAAGLTGDELAVFYEEGFSLKAPRGYWMLEYLGYDRKAVLQNGMKGWVAGGHPVSTQPTRGGAARFPVVRTPEVLCTKAEVLAGLEDPGVIRLDVRDREEWMAESSSPYGVDFAPRKGRIPGSTWLDWNLLLSLGEASAGCFNVTADKGGLKELEEIEGFLADRGVAREKEIQLYCFKGARTSTTYLALKMLGYPRVRNYLGSWNEWSRDPALPIE
jgi:thiosulfate/3-mercaptopyruvate sulfurtransferase